ncbi:MAG TPA: hypothetical protein VGP64_18110 [Polyangia bacterium]
MLAKQAVEKIRGYVLAAVIFAGLIGCGRTAPPGVLVGESAHFRLYVDPGAEVPAGLKGENALAALETEWADVHTMLQMPDGKISYYWLAPEHVAAACGEADEGACIWERSLEIDSPTLPNPHELNHAYAYLRKQREPVPFLAEGIAESIECGSDAPMNAPDVPWEGVVAAQATSDDVYVQGGAFVRYLMRKYGVAAFLSYYEQSPEQRDPALFAANFQSYWNVTLDQVWNAIHVIPPGSVWTGETKICPCSLPPLEPTGAVTNDPARAPYWPLPETSGQTLALTPPAGDFVNVRDCAGVQPILSGPSVLARIFGSEPRYVLPSLATATAGNYLADDCADAAPFSGPIVGMVFGGATIAITRPAGGTETVYLDLASSFSGTLRAGLTQICGTCGFDQGSCQPIAAGTMQKVQGPFFGRATLPQFAVAPAFDILEGDIDILGQ